MSRYRSVVSVGYAGAYALIAAAYLVAPPTATARPGVVSIARYINTLGPVWTSAFGLTAAALVAAVLLGRREWLAHCLAAAVVAGYGVAAFASGVLSDNIYGSPLAFLCAATVCQHLVMARGYQTTSVEGVNGCATRVDRGDPDRRHLPRGRRRRDPGQP